MVLPRLIVTNDFSGILHFEQSVLEVWSERFSDQAFHILKYERARSEFSHRANSLREHVTTIFVAEMLAAQREWLARGASRDQIDRVSKDSVIESGDVLLKDRPVSHWVNTASFVLQHRGA